MFKCVTNVLFVGRRIVEVSCLDCVALECYIWPYVLMTVLLTLPVARTLNEPGDCKEAWGVLYHWYKKFVLPILKKKKIICWNHAHPKQAGKVWKEKEGKHILRYPGCTSFPVEVCYLQLLWVMTMKDQEANIGGEGKEFSSTVVFLSLFDVNKMSDQSLTSSLPLAHLLSTHLN